MCEQVDDELHHHVLLAGFAFGIEKCKRHKRIVVDLSFPVFLKEEMIPRKKQDEEKRADPFVALRKGMIFDDKVEEVRGFLLDGGFVAGEPLLFGAFKNR